MRFLEITTKVSATKIPRSIFSELQVIEVDTLDPDSPEGKHHLVDDMNRAKQRGNVWAVPLSPQSVKYLLDNALPNLYDIAKDNLDKRMMNYVQKFFTRLEKKAPMAEAFKGREYNHLEDLVFIDGGAGAMRAASILNDFATSEEDISIKWDGAPTIYYGREPNGQFVMVGKNGWGRNMSTSAEDLANFILNTGKGEDWRKDFAAEMSQTFKILERSLPADFRGYVYGDLLFTPRKPVTRGKGGLQFTPNQVTYTVDPNSPLGKRVAQAQVGVVLHSTFPEFGSKEGTPLADVKGFNTDSVLALGQTYVTHKPSVNTDAVAEIQQLAKKYGPAIDAFIEPKPGLSDIKQIIYTFNNQSAKGGDLDKISVKGFFAWLENSKVSANKQAKLAALHEENPAALEGIFTILNKIAAAKNDIIDQLDAAGTDVRASTGKTPGGEGYVSLKSKTKLVPRHRWTPN